MSAVKREEQEGVGGDGDNSGGGKCDGYEKTKTVTDSCDVGTRQPTPARCRGECCWARYQHGNEQVAAAAVIVTHQMVVPICDGK